jgi:hypothetical protein
MMVCVCPASRGGLGIKDASGWTLDLTPLHALDLSYD